MSVDDPRSLPGLTDYEKDLVKSLREERRRKLGIEPATNAPTRTLAEQPVRDIEPPSPVLPDEPIQDTEWQAPALPDEPVQDAEWRAPALPDEPIQDAEWRAPAPAAPEQPVQDSSLRVPAATAPVHLVQRGRPRVSFLLIGSLLVAVLAIAAMAIFKSAADAIPDARKTAEKTPKTLLPPSQIGDRMDNAAVQKPAPVQDAAAQTLETLFANYRTDRRNGRREFRKAVMNTAPDSAARRLYLEVSANNIRLRGAPSEDGTVLRTVRRGAYVRLKERSTESGWCEVRLGDGLDGWMKCSFLKPIVES